MGTYVEISHKFNSLRIALLFRPFKPDLHFRLDLVRFGGLSSCSCNLAMAAASGAGITFDVLANVRGLAVSTAAFASASILALFYTAVALLRSSH